eukprot:11228136-Lingulodinium_polyedra.AAC.1
MMLMPMLMLMMALPTPPPAPGLDRPKASDAKLVMVNSHDLPCAYERLQITIMTARIENMGVLTSVNTSYE